MAIRIPGLGLAQLIAMMPAHAVELLAAQDFEETPVTPTWAFTGPVIYNSGVSTASNAPPNSPIGIDGSRAWETTTNSGGLALTFDNVVLPPNRDGFMLQFRLAAMNLASIGGGPDNLDYVLIAYSLDDGQTWVNRLRIRGATSDNSVWAYDATGVAIVDHLPATETGFQPTTSGLQTEFGYSTIGITFPATTTQLRLRITARSSSSTDTWMIDDVVLVALPNLFADGFEDAP